MSTRDNADFHQRIQRIAALIAEIERFPDPEIRSHVQQIVQGTLELHAAGLERILERVAAGGNADVIDELARDDLVGSLLVLHGLHPQDLETRVRHALDKARPYLRSHGGDVQLVGIVDGVVRLRMEGSCHGCPSSAMTLKLTIEEAVYEAAPDVTAIEVEGLAQPLPGGAGFVPVEALRGGAKAGLPVLQD